LKTEGIITAILTKIKDDLQKHSDTLNLLLPPENAENVVNVIKTAVNTAAAGSGVIEAACKSVVKCRLCRSGMRWTRQGGQTNLTLRTLVKSERWDAFWTLYKNARVTQIHKIAT